MTQQLPKRADYDAASPAEKGFMAYMFSAWDGSEIPREDNCPFADGTPEHTEFHGGVRAAILAAQDSEH